MKINTKIRYGIRTMLELAISYNNGGVLQKDIADNQEISYKYLDHIIAVLKNSGLIIKNPGRNGGYSLKRSPEQISVYDIYCAFEKELVINDCLLEPNRYSKSQYCSVLSFWDRLNINIKSSLKAETLHSLKTKQLEMNKASEEIMYYI